MSYVGYKEREDGGLDIGGLAQKAMLGFQAVQEVRRKRKEEIEAYDDQLQKSMADWQTGEDQNLNTMILNGAQGIRGQINDWNKQMKQGLITPEQYKTRISNLETNWGTLANTTQNYEQVMQEVLKMDQEGTLSKFGLAMNDENARLLDLPNSSLQADENGNVFVVAFDPEGKVIAKRDVRQLNNQANVIDKKYDLATNVDGLVKNLAKYQTTTKGARGAIKTVADIRENEDVYNEWKRNTIGTVLSDDRQIASILADNSEGQYEFYTGEESKQEKINSRVNKAIEIAELADKELTAEEIQAIKDEAELSLIEFRSVNGEYQPVLTKDQRKAAYNVVDAAIEAKIDHVESETAGRKPGGTGGGGDDKTTAVTPEGIFYGKLFSAWRVGDWGALSALTGDEYEFRGTKDHKVQVLKPETKTVTKTRIKDGKTEEYETTETVYKKVGSPVSSLTDLSSYFYGETDAKGQGGAYNAMMEDRTNYFTTNPDKAPKSWRKKNNIGNSDTYTINGKNYTLKQLQDMGYTASQVSQYKN